MFRPPAIAITGFIVVAAISLAGCAGSAGTGSFSPAPTAAATEGGTPTGDPQPSALLVTRTGGIAGVHDEVKVAVDGTAEVTSDNGETRPCTPNTAAVERLRAFDLAAVGSGPPSQVADGFTYSVRSGSGTATAGDGESEGIRADFVRAAAEVVETCLQFESTEIE